MARSARQLIVLCTAAPGGSGPLARLGLLMLASALTEGLGLVLLVPMLLSLDSHAAGGGLLHGLLPHLSLGWMLAAFVGLVLLRGWINLARTLAAYRFQVAVVDGLRRRAWLALLHCDWRTLAAMRQSENTSLLISNLDRVGVGISQIIATAAATATLLALGLVGMALAPLPTLLAGVAAAALLLGYRQLRLRAAALGTALGAAYDALHLRIGEGLGTMRTIKSLGGERQAERAGLEGFAALAGGHLAYLRSLGMGQLALQAGGALALAILVYLAVTGWALGLATIVPLVALFARALPLLGTVQDGLQNWAYARPALTATERLIERAEAAREPEGSSGIAPRLEREIALKQVTVQFAGQPQVALHQVSATIPAGAIVALTGPSGAGKSTLADLLAGLIGADSGTVTIDGIALDPALRRAWRRGVAYVEQDPVLLADTVRENLRWAAPEATEQRLWLALDDAAAGDFVRALPAGLDTPLGDGGRRLSGGERQRLMLARALLRDPQLLILDEATSALDPANEAAIAAALGRLRGRTTILVICHRGALLELADRIVRLDSGRLVDDTAA